MSFETETSTPAPVDDAFGNLMALIKLAADPKAFQVRLDALMAATVKANEAKVGAERAKSAQAARDAELDKREEAIASVEVETGLRRAEVNGRQERLHEILADIRKQGDQFRREILRYAGLGEHFNERLQSLPDWNALASIALGQPDPQMSGDHQPLRDEASGEVESVEHAPAMATIRRSKPLRPIRADH